MATKMTREEALNKVRQMSLPKETMEILQALAPELAESEDERIIEKIIDCLNRAVDVNYITLADRGKCLTYLEKQKEQKPAEVDESIKRLNDNWIKQHFDDYKEQKPAEWSDTKELVFKDICNHLEVEGYSGWVLLLNALHNGEFHPKKEWSEEDEEMLQSIIKDFRAGKVSTIGQEQWLKSLPERFNLQSKQEWSEEDERIRKAILGFVNPDKGGTKYSSYAELVEWSDWLKSLRPSWKPSEDEDSKNSK